jgi:hypothetical protein
MKKRLGDRPRSAALVLFLALLAAFIRGGANDARGATGAALMKALIVLPGDAEPSVRLAAADAVALLKQIPGFEAAVGAAIVDDGATFNIALAGPGVAAGAFTAQETANLPPESFRLRQMSDRVVAIAGADARGRQYAIYDILERLGFRFFHPEQSYVPPADSIAWPKGLDVFEKPDWGRRGFHFHTMHPIEASEFLLVPSAQHKIWAKHLIDWLARNKQNYWQFELLRTVDYEKAAPYFTELVEYSHARQVDAGVVVTWVFQQQKAWKLLPNALADHKDALHAALARIMRVPWDHLNLEMGGTEFTSVSDKRQVAWMNETVAWLAANHPLTTASVKVHCSTGQAARHYGGINFNYLAQFADKRMGIYPHTVMYYALDGPAPVYDNKDFAALYRWTLSMIDGERKVYYYPETAYWCSFDIVVPLFLPLYIRNRGSDIALLADKKLDGHVTFTSGHEWAYWLSDWTVARLTWNSRRSWTDALDDFAKIFGAAGPGMSAAVRDLAQSQQHWLIDRNLATYLAGEDTWNEIGYFFGKTTQQRPVMFSELYRMNAGQVRALQSGVIADLAAAAAEFAALRRRVEALASRAPAAAAAWLAELSDCFRIDELNATHAHLLWAGAAARRLHELGENPDGETTAQAYFAQAQEITRQFVATVHARETHYRYPLFYSTGRNRSVTSYKFRYLYQASTGYWLRRYEKQAIDKNFHPFLMNLIDPIWFFF